MRYFLLKDGLCHDGDIYRVHDDETTEMKITEDEWLSAFSLSAKMHKTTEFAQLEEYARRFGSLEEVDYQPEGD